MGKLTAGGLGDAWPILPSPDGALFAYYRQKPQYSSGGAAGLCVRSITGGSPVCRWGEMQERAEWRPGTHDLSVAEESDRTYVLRVGDSELTELTGQQAYFSFSPDGRWALSKENDGLWLVDMNHPSSKKKLLDESNRVRWLNATTMVSVIEPTYETREGKLFLADVDGNVTRIPNPLGSSASSISRDPKGRYLAANYGSLMSTWKHEGAALLDLKELTWKPLILTVHGETVHGESAGPWVANGKFLLDMKPDGSYLLYDPESGETQALPDELKGTLYQGLSADADWLAFLTAKSRQLLLYRVSTGELRQVDTGSEQVLGVEWVPMPKTESATEEPPASTPPATHSPSETNWGQTAYPFP